MAEDKVGLVVKVKVHGEQQLRKLKREINGLNDHVTLLKNRVTANLDSMDMKWKKHFDGVDKMVKMMGGALTKFVGMSAKFAAVQLGALAAAMVGVHGAFVLGNAAMKAFRYIAKGVAAGLASIAVAAGTAAAAIRENQAAMFAYKKMGKNEFGSGMNQVRQEMRAMARDTDLAGLSAKDLNSIYSEISKKGVYTQSSQALVKSLMDFGAAGQDVAQGAQAVGALVGMLQDPKATFAQITASAKDLGPAMENALKEAKTKGIDTVAELKGAILDGTLSVIGGVNGQFAAVNDTLIGRFKKAMNIIKADFADFGQIFLGPSKDALSEIQHTIRRTLIQVTGTITTFGKGSMMDGLTSGFAKLADGFAKMINNYLPKAEGMLKGISSWWSDFRNGWNDVLDRTRPFIDAARVIENMIKNALQPLFSEFGSAMDNTRNLILNNKQAFEEFGTRVGAFITEFGRFAGATREIFVQALPFINDAVEGATKLFRIFNDVLNAVRQIAGVDSPAGAFGLAGGLMAAGRGMKKTIGGVVPDYAKMQKTQLMNVNAGVVNVDGPGGGMASRTGGGGGIGGGGIAGGGGARSINGYPMAVNQLQARGLYGIPIPPGSQAGAMSPLRQQGMRSQVGIDNTGGGAPTGTGVTPAGGREIAPGYVSGPHNRGIYETASGRKLSMKDGAWWKAMATPNTPGYAQSVDGVDPSRYKKFMGKYGPRAQRTSEMYARFAGDEAKGIKGFNNRASTGIGATLGLGLLSSIAPESAKGALALGSGVAMFNPGAGIAIGGLGAAATSTSSGFGAASGAMGGFAAGMMTGSLPGALVGAVLGALAGGIMGAINKRKEDVRLARDAGRNLALNIQSEMLGGVSSAMATSTQMVSGMARTTAEQNLKAIISQNSSKAADFGQYVNQSDEQIRGAVDAQTLSGTGIFATMTSEERQRLRGDPQAFVKESADTFKLMANAAQSTFDIYDSRMGQYTEAFGMDSNQIFELARQSGLNLMDATVDFNSSITQLTSGLINNTAELNAYIGETFASMYDVVDVAQKAANAPKIYDEAARTVFDKAQANTLGTADIQDFLGTALQQFPAMYAGTPGGQLRGLIEFQNQFRRGGAAFQYGPNGEQFPLSGREGAFYDNGPNQQVMEQLRDIGGVAVSKGSTELLTSTLARTGLQFINPETTKNFGGNVAALASQGDFGAYLASGITTQLGGFGDRMDLATTDTERAAIQGELQAFLATLPAEFGNLATKAFEAKDASIAAQADATYKAVSDAFAAGFKLSAEVAEISTPYALFPGSPTVNISQKDADTKTPMAPTVGDTGTNLSKTLDSHQRLNSMAGNRVITSSYRDYALGSSNSDHVNGRAYDLVGDNLISYRDAVNRDGGFAQFHGDTQNRHLHVVPRIGDSMSPAYAMATGITSATSSQSSGAPVYNITVNGAGSNPEEIANMVMHKIKVNEKISKERTY
jgi:hypothetical protein